MSRFGYRLEVARAGHRAALGHLTLVAGSDSTIAIPFVPELQ